MIIQLKVDHTFIAILGTYVVFRDGNECRTLRRQQWDKTPYTRGQIVELVLDENDLIRWPPRPLSVMPVPT